MNNMKLDLTNTLAKHICDKYHLKVTDDMERRNNVLYKLMHNVYEYGIPYCPCQATHNGDTVCPCKFIRDTGACRCGLFIRDVKNK